MSVQLHTGDCLDVLRAMANDSVDSFVCDPPYNLSFMNKAWDNHSGREDVAFGYWLAGFTDGEGCFRIQRHARGSHSCAFQIKLRRDDKAILERIRRFIGHGVISEAEGSGNAKPLAKLVVQDKEGCAAVVSIFRKFPLAAKKANDFEVWAQAVNEWCNMPRGNRWEGAADQSRMSALKDRLSSQRDYVDVPWSGNKFQDWNRQWATECLRVLKPGGHLLAFSGTRTHHRLAAGLEDAGFEIRDMIAWTYGSGFPKSHNVGRTLPEWEGWGTALKPALEPITVARKPLVGTVAANVLAHGTGALNVDACRIATEGEANPSVARRQGAINHLSDRPAAETEAQGRMASRQSEEAFRAPRAGEDLGRWPANLIHDGSDEVLAAFPEAPGQQGASSDNQRTRSNCYGALSHGDKQYTPRLDAGSAARFFYQAKATKADRDDGLDHMDERPSAAAEFRPNHAEKAEKGEDGNPYGRWQPRKNAHPTVKPTALMRYLVRLVTPPGGTVCDPFMGSGSTGRGAVWEGFSFIGIELDPEHVEVARLRIAAAERARDAEIEEARRVAEEAARQPGLFDGMAAE